MPFTATLNLKLDQAGDTAPIPNLYFRIDDNISGGADSGFTGILRAYFSIDVCNNDVGDDLGQFAQTIVTVPYVPGNDPIADLDAAAMALFPDAASAADTANSIARNQMAVSAHNLKVSQSHI